MGKFNKMKKLLLLLFTALNISVYGQVGIYPGGQLTGCVGRWTFGNNLLVDSSGYTNDGFLNQTTIVPGWRNQSQQGTKFNGTTSFGILGTSQMLDTLSELTLVALVKFDEFNIQVCQANEIMSKGPDFGPGNYLIRTTDNIYDNDCNTVTPNQQKMQATFNMDNQGPTPSQPSLHTNQWYLLIATYDGVQKKMYQILMDTANYAAPTMPIIDLATGYNLGSNGNNIYFGKNGYNGTSHNYSFNGVMDEAIIFNRALDRKEIITVYNYLWNRGVGPTSAKNILKKEVDYYVANSQLNVSLKNGQKFQITVVDQVGRTVAPIRSYAAKASMDFSHLAKQILVATVVTDNGSFSFKFQN